MKKFFILAFTVLVSFTLSAQKSVLDSLSRWETGAVATLNVSQVSLINWSAGGENSMSGVALLNAFANYKKNKFQWDNTLDLAYGMSKLGDDPWTKSDDRIDLASKAGQYAFENWYYTGLLGFKSQFGPGYSKPGDDVPISNFLAPGYLNVSLGMDYKPNDHFTLFLSPLSGKITFVMDQALADAGAFGVDPGSNVRAEFGGYLKMAFKYEIMKNVNFQTKLDLFSNYLNKPENIDVAWDVLLSMKVNEYLTATITTNLIYDDDIDIAIEQEDGSVVMRPAIQFKEIFGLGLSYSF
ncbi:MAG: DUF3078 domain-containing protein [Bacteroidales bacterium]|jgi:hypothetical protein|nr:DUF3078 domain-containing protein [Bacteroidales bacterium]